MKIAIVGSPTFKEKERLFPVIESFLKEHTHSKVTFVTGNMTGVERAAGDFAHSRGIDCVIIRPYAPANGSMEALLNSVYQRNKQIVDNVDKMLIIWDGQSPETNHIIKYARAKEKAMMILTI